VPKTSNSGRPKEGELPSTLRRSDDQAKRTFTKAHDSAAEQYGEGRRAHQTAYAALKHTHQKVGDHWEPKGGGRRGPSDERAAGGRDTDRPTKGGVDANAPKSELYDIAKRLDISGRSSMSKSDLVDAIQHANAQQTRESRG
jgi:hypothetical protein